MIFEIAVGILCAVVVLRYWDVLLILSIVLTILGGLVFLCYSAYRIVMGG